MKIYEFLGIVKFKRIDPSTVQNNRNLRRFILIKKVLMLIKVIVIGIVAGIIVLEVL